MRYSLAPKLPIQCTLQSFNMNAPKCDYGVVPIMLLFQWKLKKSIAELKFEMHMPPSKEPFTLDIHWSS